MDVLKIAREAGLAVLLEGRIGQQEYSSVSGSKDALLRFVTAIGIATVQERRLHGRLRLHAFASRCRWRIKGKRTGNTPPEDLKVCGDARKRARRFIHHASPISA